VSRVLEVKWVNARLPRVYVPMSLLSQIACVFALAAILLAARPAGARAGEPGPDLLLYLDQAQTILGEARSNLDGLEFYLPLGSLKDVNDPTWSLAEQSAEAVHDDSVELLTLSPPDSLGPVNLALAQALARAADRAEAAIVALSSGDGGAGQAALAGFHAALVDLDEALRRLPPGSGTATPDARGRVL
jgi:hypothetical protein